MSVTYNSAVVYLCLQLAQEGSESKQFERSFVYLRLVVSDVQLKCFDKPGDSYHEVVDHSVCSAFCRFAPWMELTFVDRLAISRSSLSPFRPRTLHSGV